MRPGERGGQRPPKNLRVAKRSAAGFSGMYCKFYILVSIQYFSLRHILRSSSKAIKLFFSKLHFAFTALFNNMTECLLIGIYFIVFSPNIISFIKKALAASSFSFIIFLIIYNFGLMQSCWIPENIPSSDRHLQHMFSDSCTTVALIFLLTVPRTALVF